ncbi:amino acid permease [Corynebacterium sp. 335C]
MTILSLGRARPRPATATTATTTPAAAGTAAGPDAHSDGNPGLNRSLGWFTLAALGVSFVISGDFAGRQFGLAAGGFGGLFVALFIVAALYLGLCLVLAELSSALPSAGGGYLFAATAMGPVAGFATAAAILLEYVLAPAAIATFIGGYAESLGIPGVSAGWPLYLACYAVVIAIHLAGAGEAMKVMMAITAVAVVALGVYCIAMAPHVDLGSVAETAAGVPQGVTAVNVRAAVPFAIWFFLAVEGVHMAAEEAHAPHRTMPRAILGAMAFLLVAAVAMMVFGPAAGGVAVFAESDNPLVDGLRAVGANGAVVAAVNWAALAGLVASFFSIIYGYSRMTWSVANAGLLPGFLTGVNHRGVPAAALIVPGIIGFALTLFVDGDVLMSAAVFGAVVSYVLICVAHLVPATRRPDIDRPYRAPGGRATSAATLVLALGAAAATFLNDPVLGAVLVGVLVAATAAYAAVRRIRLRALEREATA